MVKRLITIWKLKKKTNIELIGIGAPLNGVGIKKVEKYMYNCTNIHFPNVSIINQKIYGLNKYCYSLWNIGEEKPQT